MPGKKREIEPWVPPMDATEVPPTELVRLREQCTGLEADFAEVLVGVAKFDKVLAADMVGYKSKTAGYDVVRRPAVQNYLAALQYNGMLRMGMSVAKIYTELAKLAYTNITDVLNMKSDGSVVLKADSLDDLPEHVRAAIQSIEVDETINDRIVSIQGAEASEDDPDNDTPTETILKRTTRRKFKIKMHNKLDALKILAPANGMNTQEPGGKGGDTFVGLVLVAPGTDPALKSRIIEQATDGESNG